MPSTLASRIERLEVDDGAITIVRTCAHCGRLVPGNPADTPCDRHPPAPKPQPGERTITIDRSYGKPPRLH